MPDTVVLSSIESEICYFANLRSLMSDMLRFSNTRKQQIKSI